MAEDKYTFEQARVRLEEIAVEVRKKDTSLEKSLDLLEEGVRLANICTELVDHTDLGATVYSPAPERASEAPVATAEREGSAEPLVDGAPLADDVSEGSDEADDALGDEPDFGDEA